MSLGLTVALLLLKYRRPSDRLESRGWGVSRFTERVQDVKTGMERSSTRIC
jgi:hypothetical protein